MIKKFKDPVSSLTHLAGAVMAIPITWMLVSRASQEGKTVHMIAFLIFGCSLLLLYSASGIYHMLSLPGEKGVILRRIDHMMVFVLIAGTYTPICLVPLKGPWGWTLLALVWGFAILGVLLKVFWLNAPRKLSTAIYLITGWLAVIAFYPLLKTLPFGGFMLLLLGGVTYSVGAVIYALKWPKINSKWFGFHEIFHLFVLGGSAFHVALMFKYILPYNIV